jgi:PleD family two-component response regulator
LSYLKRFPLDEIKVDKSFVDGLGTDADDTAIVAAVVAMAHALDLRVVAEGVETAEQLERLRTLGCEQVQGYYLARPGPPEATDELVRAEADASWQGHAPRVESYRAERVLVVDDAADVRQLARMSLAAVGFEVHEAVDGVSALTTARSIVPDCVLLDLTLPDSSGLDVCRALRSEPGISDCTIVVITSHDRAADKVAAFSAGADDYIVKPFSPRDLASRVHAAMRRREKSTNETGADR